MEKMDQVDDLIEESIFGANKFDELIEWISHRKSYELDCKITGEWAPTKEFFKGKGKILKKSDGSIFLNNLYILLEEGDLGKDNILIGNKVLKIKRPNPLIQMGKFSERVKKVFTLDHEIEEPDIIKPNTYVLQNRFKKDLQNKVFFRADQDFEKAIEWLNSFTQKYIVTCHIEGVIVSEERQIQCIVTGTVKEIVDREIYIQIEDAFDPNDPLNDDTKEWLTQDWIIQVSKVGINKVHPEYMIFEIGEELALTKKVLSVENVKVVLGGRTIIHDVNFEIEKGEILGIIGESGAGKSTTLKAILGEFEYTGDIHVFGIDAQKTKVISPFIGYVPQDLSRMYQNANALENIVIFGRQYGIPDNILIQRGKKILKDLGIDHVANQTIDSLSGGQKRRVSIAISIVHNPYLIFLDEPTSGLDPLARFELWKYLDIINKDYGITLCVISHYLDEIEYCDKSCIFLRGIGFYDYDSPEGLKEKLPGGGLALEVTLEKVSVEAVKVIKEIQGVDFVIQRGERIRVLSDTPSHTLGMMVIKKLEENGMAIHSVENKVEIDMVDYFTYVSTIHQTQVGEEGDINVLEVSGDLKDAQKKKVTNKEMDIDQVVKETNDSLSNDIKKDVQNNEKSIKPKKSSNSKKTSSKKTKKSSKITKKSTKRNEL